MMTRSGFRVPCPDWDCDHALCEAWREGYLAGLADGQADSE